MVDHLGDRAVVLGGSMAGLVAARVLAESYAEVVVVDRDELVGVTAARRGVPQGRHVHGLLARGQQILEEFFPGFYAGAVAAGIPTGDLGGDVRWFFGGRKLQPADAGLSCISAARPVLEGHVRARVNALPNVRFVERTDIVGIVTDQAGDRVTGVRVHRQGESAEEVLEADFVVDATGRGSRTPAWLEALGYERPPEDRVKINVSYTSRLYRVPDESVFDGDLSINPTTSPVTPRGGFLTRIEDGRAVLTVSGVLGDSAPTDPEGFLDFVKSLAVPDIYDIVKKLEPVSDIVGFRYPASTWRHYERLARFPERFVVLGDAACSFNPLYGQGMTVAAIEATVLREHLRRGVVAPRRFHKDIAKVIGGAWDMSAGGDLTFPEVEGHRPLKLRIANAFVAKVQAAAARDGEVTKAFMRVAGMVAGPESLMKPKMLLRILRNAKPARTTGTPAPPADRTDDPGLPRAA
ncbi:FAD-dependent oxidoreductase [Actinophytocola xinjiangensis]|nr:FAD-dependent oxidoreductase [Actinophytocola xinjiangensis]